MSIPKSKLPQDRFKVFVRSHGDDSNADGTMDAPYRQISAAVFSIRSRPRPGDGVRIIDIGEGVYDGGLELAPSNGLAPEDLVIFQGVSNKEGVPTSEIRCSANMGVFVRDGINARFSNIKITGDFSVGIHATRGVYAWFSNVHVDGDGRGRRGITVSAQSRYFCRGGLIENCTYAGIDEYFLVNRSFAASSTRGRQLVIRNCHIGLRAKEGCVGHLDFLEVEDCETGIELIQNSVANCKGVSLRRNGVGLALVNSTSHNEGGIVWGVGEDANLREVYSAGMSGELRAIMWSGENMARESTIGHRPLMVIANDYERKVLHGKQGGTITVSNFSRILPRPFSGR